MSWVISLQFRFLLIASDSIKEKERKDFTERLEIYKSGGVLVESKLKVDKNDFFIALKNSIIDAVLNNYYTIVEAPKTVVANTENISEDATEKSTEDKVESDIEENTNTDLEIVPTN